MFYNKVQYFPLWCIGVEVKVLTFGNIQVQVFFLFFSFFTYPPYYYRLLAFAIAKRSRMVVVEWISKKKTTISTSNTRSTSGYTSRLVN